MKCKIADFDIIYLSYDEPRADSNYANLKSKWPWAKRVHGVKGFDSAHKACANLAETERFITVDGDNIVDDEFFDLEFDIEDDQQDCVFSWAARNYINGLLYGNGGLKCWPVEFVQNMRTHENADESDSTVDFCWDLKYIQVDDTYCETFTNGSPFQAFRGGFREGVKMTLDRGESVSLSDIDSGRLWHGNLKRLGIWCSVGADVENGLWSIYGTRLGVIMSNLTTWSHADIADFDWFDQHWERIVAPSFAGGFEYCPYTEYRWDWDKLWDGICSQGDVLRRQMGLKIADLDEEASRFFKDVYVAPTRTGYN